MTTLPERLQDVIAEMRTAAARGFIPVHLTEWADAIEAATALQAAPEGGEWVLVPSDVLDFLHGTGELHGCAFGETPPGVRGKYWWRTYLPASPTHPAAALQAGGGCKPKHDGPCWRNSHADCGC